MRDLGIYEEVEGGGAATEEEDEDEEARQRERDEGGKTRRQRDAGCVFCWLSGDVMHSVMAV